MLPGRGGPGKLEGKSGGSLWRLCLLYQYDRDAPVRPSPCFLPEVRPGEGQGPACILLIKLIKIFLTASCHFFPLDAFTIK